MNQLDQQLQTAIVFAARYAHNRHTGGAAMICDTIKANWEQLSKAIRMQIILESCEAESNYEEWQDLRKFAEAFVD